MQIVAFLVLGLMSDSLLHPSYFGYWLREPLILFKSRISVTQVSMSSCLPFRALAPMKAWFVSCCGTILVDFVSLVLPCHLLTPYRPHSVTALICDSKRLLSPWGFSRWPLGEERKTPQSLCATVRRVDDTGLC